MGIDKIKMTETMAVDTMTGANLALWKLKSQQHNLKKMQIVPRARMIVEPV